VVGREHRAEHRQHRVELVVAERQVLCVRVTKLRVEAFGNSTLARRLEQRRHVVHPHRRRARPRGGKGRVAVAARHVQHPPTGVQVRSLGQQFAHQHDARGDSGVVAARPRLLLAGLHR
jgi:hypothetical protein